MLDQRQLLWLIAVLNAAILAYLLFGKRTEFYSNVAARKHHWSDRTGKNLLVEAERSGFRNDLAMMPYQVYGRHGTFTNILEESGDMGAMGAGDE